jgi:hypothetical protein
MLLISRPCPEGVEPNRYPLTALLRKHLKQYDFLILAFTYEMESYRAYVLTAPGTIGHCTTQSPYVDSSCSLPQFILFYQWRILYRFCASNSFRDRRCIQSGRYQFGSADVPIPLLHCRKSCGRWKTCRPEHLRRSLYTYCCLHLTETKVVCRLPDAGRPSSQMLQCRVIRSLIASSK